jgi:hypothetical protein
MASEFENKVTKTSTSTSMYFGDNTSQLINKFSRTTEAKNPLQEIMMYKMAIDIDVLIYCVRGMHHYGQ